MGYENAPATELVATHCACCGRSLVDAASVESGVGPDCRVKYGVAEQQGAADWTAALCVLRACAAVAAEWLPDGWGFDAHKACNVLVHLIAVAARVRPVPVEVLAYINAIRALGFSTLSDRLSERTAAVRIVLEGDTLIVSAPYTEQAVAELRRVPGRRWDATAKANRIPAASKRALWEALRRAYPGATAVGPKGLFALETAAA